MHISEQFCVVVCEQLCETQLLFKTLNKGKGNMAARPPKLCLAPFLLLVCLWGNVLPEVENKGHIQRKMMHQDGRTIKVQKRSLPSGKSDKCGIDNCPGMVWVKTGQSDCCDPWKYTYSGCKSFPPGKIDGLSIQFTARSMGTDFVLKMDIRWNFTSLENLEGFQVWVHLQNRRLCSQVLVDKDQAEEHNFSVTFNVTTSTTYFVRIQPHPSKFDEQDTINKTVESPEICHMANFRKDPLCRCLIWNLTSKFQRENTVTLLWDSPCKSGTKTVVRWENTPNKDAECSGYAELAKTTDVSQSASSYDVSIPGNCLRDYRTYWIWVIVSGPLDRKMQEIVEVKLPTSATPLPENTSSTISSLAIQSDKGRAASSPTTQLDKERTSTSPATQSKEMTANSSVVVTSVIGALLGSVLILVVIKCARKGNSPRVLYLPNVSLRDFDPDAVTVYQGLIRMLEYNWTDDYLDLDSDYSRDLSNKIRHAIEQLYPRSFALNKFRVHSFRASSAGGVIADFILSFGRSLEPEFKSRFYEAVRSKMLGKLKVDPATFHLTKDTKVLIMSQHCCDYCDQVLVALEDVLTSTGLFKVSLDLCHLTSVAEGPSYWYEKEAKNADKIIVFASKKLSGERSYGPSSVGYITMQLNDIIHNFIRNIIHAHLGASCDLLKFVPAYFSYNGGPSDVPGLLSGKIIHQLPEGLDHLVCFLKDVEPVRSHNIKTRIEVGPPEHPYNKKKEDLSAAVQRATRHHFRQRDTMVINEV